MGSGRNQATLQLNCVQCHPTMRWVAKAAVQGTISLVPRGEEINYFLQRNVSRRLPRVGDEFDIHAKHAAQHLAALERVRPGVDRSTLKCYEFGAGWDLIEQITMWALGVDQQTILDVRPNIKVELVNRAIHEIATNPVRLEQALGCRLRPVDVAPIASTADLRERFGITYLAPADARSVPLPDGSIDFVTSTETLEHIPPLEIAAILRETRRLLASDGVISSLIDMKDHYHYIDPAVSPYNFLRYPPWAWRLLNPGLQPQNRLRNSQYRALFTDAGYEIVFDECEPPTNDELRELQQMRIASEFRRFSWLDLGTKETHLVARRADGDHA